MIPDSTDIDDPDKLLAAACTVGPVSDPIDIPVVETARFVLDRIRARNANASPEQKRWYAMLATKYKKLLSLQLEKHESAPQTVCAGWEGPCPKLAAPSKWAFMPSHIRKRKGESWRCKSCTKRKVIAARTPEQRSESAHKANAARTPDQRSESARKANAARTPEQRIVAGRRLNAARTPEQRSEASRKGHAARHAKAAK